MLHGSQNIVTSDKGYKAEVVRSDGGLTWVWIGDKADNLPVGDIAIHGSLEVLEALGRQIVEGVAKIRAEQGVQSKKNPHEWQGFCEYEDCDREQVRGHPYCIDHMRLIEDEKEGKLLADYGA